MTTLTTDNMIAGLDQRLASLPDALTRAGILVPAELAKGLATARWALPAPHIETAERAVMSARTEAAFKSAMTELANVRLAAEVMRTDPMQSVADRARLGAAEEGFRVSFPGLLEAVIASYNDKVPTFRAELDNVPDLRGRSVYDLSAMDADALRAARDTASNMTDLLNIYGTLAVLSGYGPIGSAKTVGGATALLSCIAVFSSGSALETAASDLVRYCSGEGQHAPLMPHATAVWHGDHVEMVDFDDAAERAAIAKLNWDGRQNAA